MLPLVVLAIVLGADLWVYADAKRRAELGTPVIVTIGTIEVRTPTAWLIGCLLLLIIFFPLYIVARRAE